MATSELRGPHVGRSARTRAGADAPAAAAGLFRGSVGRAQLAGLPQPLPLRLQPLDDLARPGGVRLELAADPGDDPGAAAVRRGPAGGARPGVVKARRP